MTTTYRRSSGLAILLAAAAIGLAACGGGSPDPPHVASLGTSTSVGNGGSGKVTTTSGAANPTQLMDEWAACMRTHGDPNQTDPIIDQYGVINITMRDVSDRVSSEVHGSSGACSQYEVAAENALRAANPTAPPPDEAEQTKYVQCMRTNGVPNYPYSVGGRTDFNSAGVDPNSPVFQSANKVCGKEINAPAWWIAGTGPPGDVTVTSCNGTPNCQPPGGGPNGLPAQDPVPANSGPDSHG